MVVKKDGIDQHHSQKTEKSVEVLTQPERNPLPAPVGHSQEHHQPQGGNDIQERGERFFMDHCHHREKGNASEKDHTGFCQADLFIFQHEESQGQGDSHKKRKRDSRNFLPEKNIKRDAREQCCRENWFFHLCSRIKVC